MVIRCADNSTALANTLDSDLVKAMEKMEDYEEIFKLQDRGDSIFVLDYEEFLNFFEEVYYVLYSSNEIGTSSSVLNDSKELNQKFSEYFFSFKAQTPDRISLALMQEHIGKEMENLMLPCRIVVAKMPILAETLSKKNYLKEKIEEEEEENQMEFISPSPQNFNRKFGTTPILQSGWASPAKKKLR